MEKGILICDVDENQEFDCTLDGQSIQIHTIMMRNHTIKEKLMSYREERKKWLAAGEKHAEERRAERRVEQRIREQKMAEREKRQAELQAEENAIIRQAYLEEKGRQMARPRQSTTQRVVVSKPFLASARDYFNY